MNEYMFDTHSRCHAAVCLQSRDLTTLKKKKSVYSGSISEKAEHRISVNK